MAQTTIASANNVQQWNKAFFREWQRADQFAAYSGKTPKAIIQRVEDLKSGAGDQVTQSLVTRLTNTPIFGDNTLHNNEEAIGNYGYKHTVNQFRHAVSVGRHEQSKTHIDMLKVAGPLLKDWRAAYHRDEVIAAMQVVNVDGATRYAATSEADKDTWAAANSDRLLYGAAVGNDSSDHSADLLKVDSTNDTLDRGMVSLARRIAKSADPHLRPVKIDGMGELYVMFAGTYPFRDFKDDLADTSVAGGSILATAMQRGKSNPLFTDNALLYDNVLVVEVPEIASISGVGASAIDVGPCFLCGAQAIGYAIQRMSHAVEDNWDYGNEHGVGIAETSVVNKLIFNSKQHGMVTVYASAVADS